MTDPTVEQLTDDPLFSKRLKGSLNHLLEPLGLDVVAVNQEYGENEDVMYTITAIKRSKPEYKSRCL
jgi:hypothetical protein